MGIKSCLYLLLVILTMSSFVLAYQVPPYPVCQVKAGIVRINQVSRLADIKIISVGEMLEKDSHGDMLSEQLMSRYFRNFSCNINYSIGRGFTNVSLLGNNTFKEGQIILADISFGGNEVRYGHIVSNITISSEARRVNGDNLIIDKAVDKGSHFFIWFLLFVLALIIVYIALWLSWRKRYLSF